MRPDATIDMARSSQARGRPIGRDNFPKARESLPIAVARPFGLGAKARHGHLASSLRNGPAEASPDAREGLEGMLEKPPERRLRTMLLASMLLALALVGLVGYLIERQEAEAALQDFARHEVVVARTLAIAAELFAPPAEPGAASLAKKLYDRLGRPDGRAVLVALPGAEAYFSGNGVELPARELAPDDAGPRDSFRLPATAAARLGLPARLAVVGVAETSGAAPYRIAIAATAAHERDRGRRAPHRLLVSLLLAVAVVGGFGGVAMRAQRKELILERELALAALQNERDARLERLRRVATLGTLSIGVAHELATPLGVIAVRAEQLWEQLAADARGRHAVSAIRAQCEHINQTVRGLLTLARGDSPAMGPVSVEALVGEAVELVEHRFDGAGVNLATVLSAALPDVQVDRRLAVVALVNLLLNACYACVPGGHVRLEVSGSGSNVRFAVIDDGAGISPAVARRLSEPLFTTKPAGEGTGLGLAIVSEIVKSHQGRLEVAPGQERGTVAVIILPHVTPRPERQG
jgi:signal transduction histidine kinase